MAKDEKTIQVTGSSITGIALLSESVNIDQC